MEDPQTAAGHVAGKTVTAAPAPARCWSRAFPATARHARAARHVLVGILGDHPAADDCLLCVSELATNAAVHSASARPGGTYRLRVIHTPGTLRVEVEDDGGPWQPARGGDPQGGRGLAIVAALARTWGITEDGTATRTVWFEMDMRP